MKQVYQLIQAAGEIKMKVKMERKPFGKMTNDCDQFNLNWGIGEKKTGHVFSARYYFHSEYTTTGRWPYRINQKTQGHFC